MPPWNLQGPDTAAAAVSLEPFTDELDLAWQAYLTSGGFPRAVSEHHKTGAVSESFMRDIASWLHIDVDREAPVDSVPLLMAELHARSTSPLNRAKTAESLGYHTRHAFDLRLNRLVRSYGARAHPELFRELPGQAQLLVRVDAALAQRVLVSATALLDRCELGGARDEGDPAVAKRHQVAPGLGSRPRSRPSRRCGRRAGHRSARP